MKPAFFLAMMGLAACVGTEDFSNVAQHSTAGAPTDVAASPVSDSRIEISWTAVPDAVKYYVYRAEGAGALSYVDSVLAPDTKSLSIGLTASTQYSFAVEAEMPGGVVSAQSDIASATTYAPGQNNVATPSNVAASPVSESRIQITWDAIPGAAKYYVFRAEGAAPMVFVDSVLAPSTTSLSIGLSPTTQYWFAVGTAMQDGSESAGASAPVSATTYAPGQNNVATPTGVAAAPVSESRIEITWNPVPGAFKYYVYRAEGAGPMVYVDTALAPSTTSLSINLTPSTQYSFAVGTAMQDGSESSGASAPVTATTYAPGLNNVAVPASVTATAISDTRIEVSFAAVPGAFKYYIYRAEGAGPMVYVDTVLAPSTTSLSVNLQPSTQYTFAVGTAMPDGSESSGTSSTASTSTMGSGQNNVATPSNVSASATSHTSIELTWDAVPGAFKYYIYRAEGAGSLVYVDTVLAPSTTSVSMNLSPSTQYSFAVGTAMNDGSESVGTSAPVSATTHAPPGAAPVPTGLSAAAISDTRIELTWSSTPGAVKYYVLRSEAGAAYAFVGSVVDPATSFTHVNLAPETEYSFEVVAVMGDGRESAASASTSATTWSTPAE